MRQIDRLLARAGRNNELTYCPCEIDGEDYSFYVKPLTAMQLDESRKSSKAGVQLTDLASAVKLLTLRALDENGVRIYQADAFSVLMRIPLEDLGKLTGAMNVGGEDEEGEALDMKSPEEGTKKRKPAAG